MNTKRTTKSKANARLLALLTALCLVIGIVPIVASASGEIQSSIDTDGESGYQIEITETTASFPIKISAGEGGGELDHFDASIMRPIPRYYTSGGAYFVAGGATVYADCENVGQANDSNCYIKVSSDSLVPGTVYQLVISGLGNIYKGTDKGWYGDLPTVENPKNLNATYKWHMASSLFYVFKTPGQDNENVLTQWGDNPNEDNQTVQVIYYGNGSIDVAPAGRDAMSDCTASGESPWSFGGNSYCRTTQSINIRDGVKHIGNYTFSPLINLTTVTTGYLDPLTSIGEGAFNGCTSLRDVYLYADAEDMDIAPTAFDGCSDVTIHVKPDQLAAYQAKYPDLANVTFAGDLTPDVEPTAPELVSSEGNDLIAKTYTDLELQNAPGEGYEYKFIVYNETTNQWYKLQDFSDATTFRWHTGPAGVKNLYVDIRNKSDETDVTRVELTGVNVTDSGLAATLAIEPTGELAAKTQATLTATATGGTGEYQYKFIVFNATTNQWYKLKDFGPESEFDWYTGPAGTKTLYVDVKDANGVVERAALENIVVK